jgi:response regulator RpfG family c-di-GMP phosphodiesterase
MMDGSISVESELGRGSIFTLLVEFPEAVPLAEANPNIEFATTERLYDADILLAEDNHINQKLAISMLTRLGCRVTLAQNGREAVELAGQCRYRIILMDCQMPVMDGFAASRVIRSKIGEAPIMKRTLNARSQLQNDRSIDC